MGHDFASMGFGLVLIIGVAGCGLTQPPSCDGSDRTPMNAGKWDGAMTLGCPSRQLGGVSANHGATEAYRILEGPNVTTRIEFAEGKTFVSPAVSAASEWSTHSIANAVFVTSTGVSRTAALHIVTTTTTGRERHYEVELGWETPSEQKKALLTDR